MLDTADQELCLKSGLDGLLDWQGTAACEPVAETAETSMDGSCSVACISAQINRRLRAYSQQDSWLWRTIEPCGSLFALHPSTFIIGKQSPSSVWGSRLDRQGVP